MHIGFKKGAEQGYLGTLGARLVALRNRTWAAVTDAITQRRFRLAPGEISPHLESFLDIFPAYSPTAEISPRDPETLLTPV